MLRRIQQYMRYFGTIAGLLAIAVSALAEEVIEVKKGDLSVLFRDNEMSPKILSGLQSLFNVKHAVGYDSMSIVKLRRVLVSRAPMANVVGTP